MDNVWDDKKRTLMSIYFGGRGRGGWGDVVECCLGDVFSRSCLKEKPAITQWSKHDGWQIYLSQTSLNTAVNKKRDACKPPAKIFPLSSKWCKAVFFSSCHMQQPGHSHEKMMQPRAYISPRNCGFAVLLFIELLYIYKPSSVSCPTFLLRR